MFCALGHMFGACFLKRSAQASLPNAAAQLKQARAESAHEYSKLAAAIVEESASRAKQEAAFCPHCVRNYEAPCPRASRKTALGRVTGQVYVCS